MRINRDIRKEKVRVIAEDGKQLGIMSSIEALTLAQEKNLDLIEIAPKANPPVCKIIDYGKFMYQKTKREKENKKTQHQIKIKEVKFRPNIDVHDYQTKINHAKEFIKDGNKVRFICMFRGREMLHKELGMKLIQKAVAELEEIAITETPSKLQGRFLSIVLSPKGKKK